ncbi:MAG: DUF1311 domain-containing protein [Proteobacteria bacterium]|nr:DUF1311 domain-containing protein [Pseudomonadota bacterium]MBU1611354.1 DUF1311 domain-containing protein [Pseudomonadota bacterium]
MRLFVVLAGLMISGCLGTLALAEEAPNCSGTQTEMNICSGTTLDNENATLDLWYRRALKKAQDDEARALFTAAQQAWEKFRKTQCALEADEARGGSMAPLIESACLTHLARGRIVELQSRVVNEFGGGPAWPESLSRMLMIAGEVLPESIFWLPSSVVESDLDGDGAYDIAAIGINPGNYTEPESTVILIVAASGSENIAWTYIPVSEDGLCAESVMLGVDYPEGELPYLVVDDGACDAFRFRLNPDQETLELFRN